MTVTPGNPGPPGAAGFNPYGAVDLGALAQQREAREKAQAARAKRSAGGATSGDDAPASVTVIDATEATFQVDVIERSMTVPVVIDFWAEWCEPCKQLSPVLERFAAQDAGSWVLAKVDVDANPQLSAAAQVQSIPTTLVVWQGQVIPGFTGALPEAQVRDFLDQVVALAGTAPAGPAAGTAAVGDSDAGEMADDPALEAADDALARDDLDAAEAAYREILATQPDHQEARQGLGSLTLLRRTEGADPAAVMAAANGSDDPAANALAADFELLAGDVDASFARLIALIQRTGDADREAAKQHLLELLELVGNDDPRVLAARRQLANALF